MSNDSAEIWAEDEYRFHGQRQDEHVMLVKNQHPMVLFRLAVFSVVSLLIPYLLASWVPSFATKGIIIYFAILVFVLVYRIYGYRNSVSILTDQRILNVQQHGFFNCQISEAELDRIQDVSSEIKGVWQTMFGFGNVTIRTASKDSLLVLSDIGSPYDVQQAIVRSLKEIKKAE